MERLNENFWSYLSKIYSHIQRDPLIIVGNRLDIFLHNAQIKDARECPKGTSTELKVDIILC